METTNFRFQSKKAEQKAQSFVCISILTEFHNTEIEEEERILSKSTQSSTSITPEASESTVIVSMEEPTNTLLEEPHWIIKDINGYASSGEMTAILGAR